MTCCGYQSTELSFSVLSVYNEYTWKCICTLLKFWQYNKVNLTTQAFWKIPALFQNSDDTTVYMYNFKTIRTSHIKLWGELSTSILCGNLSVCGKSTYFQHFFGECYERRCPNSDTCHIVDVGWKIWDIIHCTKVKIWETLPALGLYSATGTDFMYQSFLLVYML